MKGDNRKLNNKQQNKSKKIASNLASKTFKVGTRKVKKELMKKAGKKALAKGAKLAVNTLSAKILFVIKVVVILVLILILLISSIGSFLSNIKAYLNPLNLINTYVSDNKDLSALLDEIDISEVINPSDIDRNISPEEFETTLLNTIDTFNILKKENIGTYNDLMEKLNEAIYLDEVVDESEQDMPFNINTIYKFYGLEKSSYAWSDIREDNPTTGYFPYTVSNVEASYSKTEYPTQTDWVETSHSEVSTQEKQSLRSLTYPFRVPWQTLMLLDFYLANENGAATLTERESILRDSLAFLTPIYTYIYPGNVKNNPFPKSQQFDYDKHPIGFNYLGLDNFESYDTFSSNPLKLENFNFTSPYASEEQRKNNILKYKEGYAAFTLLDSRFSNNKVQKADKNDIEISQDEWSYSPHNQQIINSEEAIVKYTLPTRTTEEKLDGWNEDKTITTTTTKKRRIEDNGSSGDWSIESINSEMDIKLQKESPKLYLKRAANAFTDTRFSYEVVSEVDTLVSDSGPVDETTQEVFEYEEYVGEDEDGISIYEDRYYIIETTISKETKKYNSYERVLPNVFSSNEVDNSNSFANLFDYELDLGIQNINEFRDTLALLPGGREVARGIKGAALNTDLLAPYEIFSTDEYYDTSLAALDSWLKPSDVPLETVYYNQKDYQDNYGGSTIANVGSAPTAISMILASYQKTYKIPTPPDSPNPTTPVYCANWAQNNNYATDNGTKWSYFAALSKLYGVNTTQLSTTSASCVKVQNALRGGSMVIASVNKGIFRENNAGYIVLYNLNDDKTVSVYDTLNEKMNGNYNFNDIYKDITQFWILTPYMDTVSLDINGVTGSGAIPSCDAQIGTYTVTGNGSVLMPLVKLNKVGATFRISSGYGGRVDPINQSQSYHKGIDIPGSTSDKICAIADGTITQLRRTLGSTAGLFIWIDHGGILSKYMHMSAISSNLKVGSTVKAGDILGNMGTTGASTGVHLHIEILKGNTALYPLYYLPATKN